MDESKPDLFLKIWRNYILKTKILNEIRLVNSFSINREYILPKYYFNKEKKDNFTSYYIPSIDEFFSHPFKCYFKSLTIHYRDHVFPTQILEILKTYENIEKLHFEAIIDNYHTSDDEDGNNDEERIIKKGKTDNDEIMGEIEQIELSSNKQLFSNGIKDFYLDKYIDKRIEGYIEVESNIWLSSGDKIGNFKFPNSLISYKLPIGYSKHQLSFLTGSNLTSLDLNHYKEKIPINVLPKTLIKLKGFSSEYQLEIGTLPIGLKYLEYDCNHSLSPIGVLPNTIEILIFKTSFSNVINENELPTSLKVLDLSWSRHNSPLDKSILKDTGNLQTLLLSNLFDKELYVPSSVTKLIVGPRFNGIVPSIFTNTNLKKLKFKSQSLSFPSSISNNTKCLEQGIFSTSGPITSLKVPLLSSFKFEESTIIPESVNKLTIDYPFDNKLIPTTVTYLKYPCVSRQDINYPSHITHLRITQFSDKYKNFSSINNLKSLSIDLDFNSNGRLVLDTLPNTLENLFGVGNCTLEQSMIPSEIKSIYFSNHFKNQLNLSSFNKLVLLKFGSNVTYNNLPIDGSWLPPNIQYLLINNTNTRIPNEVNSFNKSNVLFSDSFIQSPPSTLKFIFLNATNQTVFTPDHPLFKYIKYVDFTESNNYNDQYVDLNYITFIKLYKNLLKLI